MAEPLTADGAYNILDPLGIMNETGATRYADLAQSNPNLNEGEIESVGGYRQPSDERVLADQAGSDAFDARIAAAKSPMPTFTGPTAATGDEVPTFTGPGEGPLNMSQADANFFVFQTTFKDTVRGIPQWMGYENEKDAADQKLMNRIFEDPELGGQALGWAMAGYVADPVGWLIPVSKMKHIKTVAQFAKKMPVYGAIGGAISGATGYVDPDGKSLVGMMHGEDKPMTRLEQTGLGTAVGTVLGPAAGLVGKGVAKAYEPIGKLAWKGLQNPAGTGATVGAAIGYNVDPDATAEDKWLNALYGATTGMAAGRAPKFLEAVGTIKPGAVGSTKWFGEKIIPDYDKADAWIHGMNRFRGLKGQYAKDWDDLTQGVLDLPVEARKVIYRMLQNRNMGLDDAEMDYGKLGLTAEARAKIQEYGQAMVNLGVLDDKVFMKNIDDYLTTSYLKHDQMNFYDPTDRLQNANHMFHMRGRVEKMDKKQWEAGQRPKEKEDAGPVGEWEFIDDLGNGQVRVRRQWTKPEKAKWGEIEDAGYALHKTGRMMSHERALGEFFNDISQSPDIVKTAQPGVTVKVPNGKIWGNMAGKHVEPKVWEELKKLREFSKDGSYDKAIAAYKVMNGVWKGGKTILSPPVHVGNILSSGSMFDLAGGAWADIPRAAKNMYKQDKLFQQMQEDGVFGSGVLRELEEGREILKVYANESAGYWPRLGDGPGGLTTAIQWATKMAKMMKKIGWDAPGKLYQLEDSIWRAGLYRTRLDQHLANGIDERTARGMAARAAKEFFVDYDQNPPLLKGLRHTFLPFLSYTYGTMPRLAEITAKNPMKLAKWAGMMYGLNVIGEKTSGHDQDKLDTISNRVEPNGMFGMPWMPNARTALPEFITDIIAPGSKDVQSLNVERDLAGGKLSMSEGGVGQIPGVPDFVQPSGGLAGAVIAPMIGINTGLGTEVESGDKLDTVIRNVLPNWQGMQLGDLKTWATDKVDRADSGKTTPNRDDYTPITARLSNVGIRVEPLNDKKLAKRIVGKYKGQIDVLKRRLRKLNANTGIDEVSKKRQMDAIKADIRKKTAALKRRLNGE